MRVRIVYLLMLILLLLLTSCVANNVVKPAVNVQPNSPSSSANDILNIIPADWHLLERIEGEPEKVEGDLNKDGINDVAMVIEEINKPTEGAPKRALLMALGKGNGSYTLSVIAENAVLKSDEGGVWGDPLEGVSIDRGSVLISFYGGSNWRWYSAYRFRFQDDDWYLIGATIGSYFTGNATGEEEDYNLLTGDFIKKTTDEKGNVQTTKGNRGKRELLRLKDFVANSEEVQF